MPTMSPFAMSKISHRETALINQDEMNKSVRVNVFENSNQTHTTVPYGTTA